MDDSNNSQFLAFDSPLNQSSYIKVIGVGGGGNNAVNHMFRRGITGVDFIVCNTDTKALNGSPVQIKLQLGQSGLGAGNDPAKARRAAEGKEQEIRELFEHNTKMVFITAGMGGGTGTGAAPVIARIAKEVKIADDDMDEEGRILVVAVVTTPFQFEGKLRLRQALEGVEELRKHVDSILVINNEKLRGYGNLVITDAFAMANDVLLTAVKGIAEIITLNASVNIDFRDVNTVMESSGTALMGIGEGEGEHRARQAVEQATTSVLLDDNDIAGAKNVLLYFSYGPEHEITMDEMSEITDYLCQKTGSPDTNVIWGTGVDESLGEKVKITLIATGFEQSVRQEPKVIDLRPEQPTPKPTPKLPVDSDEPQIVTRPVRPEEVVDRPQPTDLHRETVDQPTKPRIISLYDEEEKTAKAGLSRELDPTDDGMRIINHQKEQTQATEVKAPAPEPIKPIIDENTRETTVSDLESEAARRSERIKRMHDLLRNDANGAAIVENMNPMKLTGEQLFEATHSSESSAKSRMTSDGTIKPNGFLYNSVD